MIQISAPIAPATPIERESRFFRPELDALRFLAFLLVFMCHATPAFSYASKLFIRACGYGVQVFFLLSAYLITELLMRERRRTQTINLRAFYMRRMLRIWPLYFLALLAIAILSMTTQNTLMPAKALLWYVLLAGNWYTAFYQSLPYGFGVLWSISVEEQFYLIWPSLIKFSTRKAILWASVFAWMVSQLGVAWLCERGVLDPPRIWTDSLTNLQYFAIGAYVSAKLNGSLPKTTTPQRIYLVTSGFLVFLLSNLAIDVSAANHNTSLARDYPRYLGAGLGAVLIFLGFLGAKLPSSFSPLVFLGKISYGLYVFHVAVMALCVLIVQTFFPSMNHLFIIRYGLGLPLTILVGMTSYKVFETPFLRLKERFEVVHSRPT